MDRLTVKSVVFDGHCVLKSMCTFDNEGNIKGEGDCASCGGGCDEFCGKCEIQKAFDRLAAYEDTGFTPEEITALKADNERLHKLVDTAQNLLWGNTETEEENLP